MSKWVRRVGWLAHTDMYRNEGLSPVLLSITLFLCFYRSQLHSAKLTQTTELCCTEPCLTDQAVDCMIWVRKANVHSSKCIIHCIVAPNSDEEAVAL